MQITGTVSATGSTWSTVPTGLIPVGLVLGLLVWTGRFAQRSLAGGMDGFGRSKVKIIEAERPTTRFADIAGYEGKQRVVEGVDFLRDPGCYAARAKGPRGVIMVGPPGSGNTLLARVAGEASVPFLSVTGFAFVEQVMEHKPPTGTIVLDALRHESALV